MADAKTKPTKQSVAAHLDALDNEALRKDCKALVTLMRRITGCAPVMWGPSIIGFDQYQYPLANGKTGESCLVGFAPRKSDITIYLLTGYDGALTVERLAKLGKHKIGKACLYIKRLADVQTDVLEALITDSVAEMRRRHPKNLIWPLRPQGRPSSRWSLHLPPSPPAGLH